MLHSFNKPTHTVLLISNVSTILVCPKYIYIYLLLQVAVNLWESEIGFFLWSFSRNGFGGLQGSAGVADFALSEVIATCSFTIYHFLVNVLGF